jgi:hypothetical protein
MLVERDERCDDGHTDCPICRGGEVVNEFVERVKAAAAQPGQVMTAEEFVMWLDSLGAPSTGIH